MSEDFIEILFSFPLTVKDAIGSVVELEFSDALPAVSFPFAGTISTEELSDAITRMLRLAICFELG